MNFGDGGRGQSVTLGVLLIALLAVLAVAGLVLAGDDATADDRTGAEILEDVQATYSDADSVVTDAAVTVKTESSTTQFEVSAAAAGTDRARLNISDGHRYLLVGESGEQVWLHEPESGLTGVLAESDHGLTASIRAGPEALSGLGLADPSTRTATADGGLSGILAEFDGELSASDLPDTVEDALDELPENTTLPDSALGGAFDGDSPPGDGSELPEEFDAFDFSEAWNSSELPEEFDAFDFPEEWNSSDLPGEWNSSDLPGEWESIELPEMWNGSGLPETFEKWNESELREEWNKSALLGEFSDVERAGVRQRLDGMLTGEFSISAFTVEHVNTTTIDGREANELLLTHPDGETETRLWTDVERDTVLKQRTTAPGATVTVDVRETQFDVAAADSTFEPPGVVELASLTLSTAETGDEFGTMTPFEPAVPADRWTFERGSVLSGELSTLLAASGPEPTNAATATYTDGELSLLVGQVDRTVDWEALPENATGTETVGDRDIHLLGDGAGAWTEDGMTVVVAGELDESQLRSVIAGIEFEDTGT